VIVEAGAETVGVVVVAIEEVLTVEDTQIDDVPGTGGDGADAIARIGDRLVVLLSPARLFDGLGAVAA
jgi:chemotaxis signal transduction protein